MKVFRNALIFVFASFFALLLCEIILRLAGVTYPVFDTYDEVRGVSLRPNKEGWYRNEGEAYLRINSMGYRDVEHAVDKDPGTYRIAVLGDSFTEARQVAVEDTFWSYLENNLNTCDMFADRRIEVMNFGVGGYGTSQQLLTLEHHVLRFSPDMVLLAFFSGNDLANNSKYLMNRGAWRDDFRPFHTIRNGNLILDSSFRDPSVSFFFRRYVLYEGIHHLKSLELVNRARRLWKSRARQNAIAKGQAGPVPDFMPEIYSPPLSAAWSEAWLVTEKLLATINQEVKNHHAIFLVATLSNAEQVHPDVQVRKRLLSKYGLADLFYPERRMKAIGREHGFPVITLAESLQREATENNIFLHGSTNTGMGVGHWNVKGHRLAGKILVDEICSSVTTAGLSVQH